MVRVPDERLPFPAPNEDTAAFWNGTSAGRLLVQQCRKCGEWIWLPRPVCPVCHSFDPVWTEVAGAGSLASWIIPYPPVLPALQALLPFAVVLVELDEGPRMVGFLANQDGQLRHEQSPGLAAGMRMAVRFWNADEYALPCWTVMEE